MSRKKLYVVLVAMGLLALLATACQPAAAPAEEEAAPAEDIFGHE